KLIIYVTTPAVVLFTDPATTEIYTLSLHDALPILRRENDLGFTQTGMLQDFRRVAMGKEAVRLEILIHLHKVEIAPWILACAARSEEHTSELQSLAYLVCRLLLEKKKQL